MLNDFKMFSSKKAISCSYSSQQHLKVTEMIHASLKKFDLPYKWRGQSAESCVIGPGASQSALSAR